MSADIGQGIADHVVAQLAAQCGVDAAQLLDALRVLVRREDEYEQTGRAMSVADVAERIGRDHQAVRRAIRRGDLVAYKIAGRLNIYERDFLTWHDERRVTPETSQGASRLPMRAATVRRSTNGLVRLLDQQREEA